MSWLLRSSKYPHTQMHLRHSLYITNSKHVWMCWAWTCGYMHANSFFQRSDKIPILYREIKPSWTCQSVRHSAKYSSRPTSVFAALLERRQLGRETVERRCWRQASPDSCVREEEREKESYRWSRRYLFYTLRWLFSGIMYVVFVERYLRT